MAWWMETALWLRRVGLPALDISLAWPKPSQPYPLLSLSAAPPFSHTNRPPTLFCLLCLLLLHPTPSPTKTALTASHRVLCVHHHHTESSPYKIFTHYPISNQSLSVSQLSLVQHFSPSSLSFPRHRRRFYHHDERDAPGRNGLHGALGAPSPPSPPMTPHVARWQGSHRDSAPARSTPPPCFFPDSERVVWFVVLVRPLFCPSHVCICLRPPNHARRPWPGSAPLTRWRTTVSAVS